MEYVAVGLVALLASLLTFFSGFGLGTILLPVFSIFFPIELAVALTGVVHLLNNLFKITLIGRNANWEIVLKFGIPAIGGAFIGAWLLTSLSNDSVWYVYTIGSVLCTITPVKVLVAILMFGFSILEISKFFKELEFEKKKLYFGGILSGFFGGLSGHQGALRSAFLIKCGLSKEAFIATGIIIASFIDISRISIYFARLESTGITDNIPILTTAVLSAFIGAFIGRNLLKKVTINFLQITVSILIMILAIMLGAGIL